jgi:hypothetical protein
MWHRTDVGLHANAVQVYARPADIQMIDSGFDCSDLKNCYSLKLSPLATKQFHLHTVTVWGAVCLNETRNN